MRSSTRRKLRRWALIGASATIGILVIAGLALSSYNQGGTTSTGGAARDYTEGIGTPVDIMSSTDHRDVGEFISYSTTPPTSGPHWGSPEWADCGIHEAGVPDERIVHNMEHGHIIISYNLPNEDEVARMVEVAKGLPDLDSWGVVRPYSNSEMEEGTVAMTAWGVIETIEGVDEERILSFYTEYARNRFSEETAQFGAIRCTGSVG
jgi:hypothetical protein